MIETIVALIVLHRRVQARAVKGSAHAGGMVRPGYFLVTDDFREMEDQGLLTLAFYGDEYVIRPTTYGRLWLEQYDAEQKESNHA